MEAILSDVWKFVSSYWGIIGLVCILLILVVPKALDDRKNRKQNQ